MTEGALYISLNPAVIKLSPRWCSAEEAGDVDDKDIFERIKQDIPAFLEELGGIEGIVEAVWWE